MIFGPPLSLPRERSLDVGSLIGAGLIILALAAFYLVVKKVVTYIDRRRNYHSREHQEKALMWTKAALQMFKTADPKAIQASRLAALSSYYMHQVCQWRIYETRRLREIDHGASDTSDRGSEGQQSPDHVAERQDRR